MSRIPQTGEAYIYSSSSGEVTFRVIGFNASTGCVHLSAECSHEKALEVLRIQVRDKHGQVIEVPAFAWLGKERCFAANIEWDAWKAVKGPVEEGPCTTLTRLAQAICPEGYE